MTPWRATRRGLPWLLFAVQSIACGRPGVGGAGATLRLALINDPIMNPVLASELGSILINKVIFPGLLRPDSAGKPAPDLALSWEITPDQRRYTFHLRPNVVWHDGTPFRAEDVKFTFDQILDPKSGSLLWSDFSVIDQVEVADSLTVRFELKAPFAPFLTLLGHNAGIAPAHAFTGRAMLDATDFNRTKPIGTGPFQVSSAVSGSSITLSANPRYYGPAPKLARVVFKIVPSQNAQVAQLRAGELDLVTIEPGQLAQLAGDSSVKVSQVSVPQHYYVGFNQQLPLFKPAVLRRALGMAVDRQALIDGVLKGSADFPTGTIPRASQGFFADELPPLQYDTTKALALFAEAGWRRGSGGRLQNAKGEPLRLTLLVDKGNPTREQAAVAIQQDFKRVGVDLTIRAMEFASMVRDYIQTKRYEAYLIWWNTPSDPDQYGYYGTGQANNDVSYSNRRADSLLRAGRATNDVAARKRAYAAFQALELEDPPVLVLFYPREIQARSARLRGVPPLGIRDALRWVEQFELAPE
ncbi:MAG: ABC transporter substrate-binding protein [Gemmatimonadota bacterium]